MLENRKIIPPCGFTVGIVILQSYKYPAFSIFENQLNEPRIFDFGIDDINQNPDGSILHQTAFYVAFYEPPHTGNCAFIFVKAV